MDSFLLLNMPKLNDATNCIHKMLSISVGLQLKTCADSWYSDSERSCPRCRKEKASGEISFLNELDEADWSYLKLECNSA